MYFSVFVVLSFVAVFVTGSEVEEEKCAWGESYWCSDLRVAKACGAVQHCKTTVWKSQQLTADTTEVCEFCQTIVTDVHKFITEKKTEDDIAHFLASACGIIPTEKAATECKVLVQTFLPEIINLITSEVSPQIVCGLLKLCTGLEDTVQHSDIVPSTLVLHHVPLQKDVSVHDTEICTDCKKFMSDIRKWLLSPEYEAQVEKLIDENVCVFLGAFESQCKMLVHDFLPQIINATAQYYDPNVLCIAFCGASGPKIPEFFTNIKVQSVEGCMLCKTILGEVQALDRDAKVQADIKNFLKADLCSNLGSLKTNCLALIDRYSPSVFELLATLLDPTARCSGFGFCPGISPVISDSHIVRSATPRDVAKSEQNISPQCVLCEFIMKELDSLLTDNATETEIIAALDKVCSLMPEKIREPCTDFVNTYGPAVIALLQQELDPAQICTFLGLCTSSTHNVVSKKITATDPETCIICETVVQYVEALLEENATVSEIEMVVKKVCNFLPDAMKAQCSDIVDKYGPLIVHLIATKYSPKEVCTIAKLCTTGNGVVPSPMVNLVPAGKPRLVGTSQCSYGPVYWCASQQNAEQCGAVDHCKQFVWKK